MIPRHRAAVVRLLKAARPDWGVSSGVEADRLIVLCAGAAWVFTARETRRGSVVSPPLLEYRPGTSREGDVGELARAVLRVVG